MGDIKQSDEYCENLKKKAIYRWNLPFVPYRNTYLFPQNINVIKEVEKFVPQDTDIVLASFMKTGTTWAMCIILSLLNSGSTTNVLEHAEAHQQCPNLERGPEKNVKDCRSGLQMIADLNTSPRFYNTHLPFAALPKAIKENKKVKIIYITRNPKDTIVSWYHFWNHCAQKGGFPGLSIENITRQIVGEEPIFFGPFSEHVEQYWNIRNQENVLFITYEDLKQEYHATIQKIAKFLGIHISEDHIVRVASNCELKSLQSLDVNQRNADICKLHNSSFFRKGQVGNWKDHLTVRQNETIDNWLQDGMETKDFSFKFE